MTESEHPDHMRIDRLVGEHLDRQAERIDAAALLERIHASRDRSHGPVPSVLPHPHAPARRSGSWSRPASWSVVAMLAVLLAFVVGRISGPMPAHASTLLLDVQAVYLEEIDRRYDVQYAPDPRYWDRENTLEGPSQSVLWTRGDRFWAECTIGDITLRLGREADGTLWVSPSRDKGIRFTNDASQLPDEVALLCAINSMTVPRLVDDVLAGFDLRFDQAEGEEGRKTVIWASLKPGHVHPLLSSAVLEIDERSRILERLVLWTVQDGRPKGTVTFTFQETAARSDEQYRMEFHLDEDAEIEFHTLKDNESDS
jgi:hypothetical protein